eukprot:1980166-Amphidinium_carterae.1
MLIDEPSHLRFATTVLLTSHIFSLFPDLCGLRQEASAHELIASVGLAIFCNHTLSFICLPAALHTFHPAFPKWRQSRCSAIRGTLAGSQDTV